MEIREKMGYDGNRENDNPIQRDTRQSEIGNRKSEIGLISHLCDLRLVTTRCVCLSLQWKTTRTRGNDIFFDS
jgi:hypothetical protein